MSKAMSDAQVHETIRECSSRYLRRQNELNARERQAESTLSTLSEIMDAYAKQMNSSQLPAMFHSQPGRLWVDVGVPPNIAGRIAIQRTADFQLVVTRRRARQGQEDEVHDSAPRLPSDFGGPHWRREFNDMLLWIFEGAEDDRDDDGM